MYKSPIELIMGSIQTQQEEGILKAVQSVGVNVDKDELIKCLQYDRNQYRKGYEDGAREFAELVKLEFYKEFDELIPSIMADKIDNLLKEKWGE